MKMRQCAQSKPLLFLFPLLLFALLLAGCGKEESVQVTKAEQEKYLDFFLENPKQLAYIHEFDGATNLADPDLIATAFMILSEQGQSAPFAAADIDAATEKVFGVTASSYETGFSRYDSTKGAVTPIHNFDEIEVAYLPYLLELTKDGNRYRGRFLLYGMSANSSESGVMPDPATVAEALLAGETEIPDVGSREVYIDFEEIPEGNGFYLRYHGLTWAETADLKAPETVPAIPEPQNVPEAGDDIFSHKEIMDAYGVIVSHYDALNRWDRKTAMATLSPGRRYTNMVLGEKGVAYTLSKIAYIDDRAIEDGRANPPGLSIAFSVDLEIVFDERVYPPQAMANEQLPGWTIYLERESRDAPWTISGEGYA